MDNRLIHYLARVFAFFNRRWRRQAVWLGTGPLVSLVVTRSLTVSMIIAVLSVIIYLGWTTMGNAALTTVQARKLLKQVQMSQQSDLVDASAQLGFKASEKVLGQFTKNGFVSGNVDDTVEFRGIISCIKRFSLQTRYIVTLVEINGKRYVRKSYTSCDYNFYRGLRNNLMVRNLGISPQLEGVSVPGRTLWIEFVAGPSLHDVSETTVMSQAEQDSLFRQLNEFYDSLHQLGLCNLDIHRGNIILRSSDGQPLLIDMDEARLYSKDNILYKLYCILDRQVLDRELDLLVERNRQNIVEKL